VRYRIFVQQSPLSRSPQIRTTTSKCIAHEPEYRDVSFLVECLPLRDKIVMNNTPGVEKRTIIIVFIVDGCFLILFDGGVPVDRH